MCLYYNKGEVKIINMFKQLQIYTLKVRPFFSEILSYSEENPRPFREIFWIFFFGRVTVLLLCASLSLPDFSGFGDVLISYIDPVAFSLLFLGVVAFFTLLERKGMAAIQRREGPNVAGPYGLLQPIADGLKLILKELWPSEEVDFDFFFLAPVVSFVVSFLT